MKATLIGAVCVLMACEGSDAVAPTGTVPGTADGANLKLVQVVVTQGAQEPDGSIPLVAGMPAAVNVMIARSTESAKDVPVVLRLFRGSTVVRVDTTRTVGILGPSISPASPSAQFLIPATVVTDSLSWQVEIDPAQIVVDSTRVDNLLPVGAPQRISIVHLPALDVHFVPIALSTQADVMGDVSELNAAQYLTAARAMLPTGPVTFSVGAPLSVQANFGTRPAGGDVNFWHSALQDVDAARWRHSTRCSRARLARSQRRGATYSAGRRASPTAHIHASAPPDVMSYCYDVWSSPYAWSAVLKWRQASGGVVTSTARTSLTLVAGSIARDGRVTRRPALMGDALLPADDPSGDVTVELRGAGCRHERGAVSDGTVGW